MVRPNTTRAGLMVILSVLVLYSCVKNRDFDAAAISNCSNELISNASFLDIKNLYSGETVQIQENLIIEGYVISSDKEGNFFSVLHFQDRRDTATQGLQIEIDVRDSHLFYPVGSKIFIKVKGLYLGQTRGAFKLGATFESFGNISVGRLPSNVVDRHIFISCEQPAELTPTSISLDSIGDQYLSTLVQFDNMEIFEDELGLPFALAQEETLRTLVDCEDRQINLTNSGFSDFQAELLPTQNGTVQGVLVKENSDYSLVIRNLDDMQLEKDRCEELVDEFTSTQIFISELADPDNNTGARFVELFNSSTEPLSLNGWSLRRYTNANTDVSSSIDLSGHEIGSQSTFVISPNANEFEAVYGFAPDLGVGTNSPADSNGDDNLELVDPFGVVIDIFGVIGEDGSSTNHEFEDGKAVRKPEVVEGNTIYDYQEWSIFNDSGDAETTNEPQLAPNDFTPGIRN
ncbi:DUF5689 domain-containing protein [Pseudozobellia sp. WGM2]|uniref:DUF5689 domain-containing protein n=1 Tax=Pseudozobellia sp. WGM2 TaxID=2787625 RepID=UPI001ADF10B2|nr:DUF5689 domain-containing protein [Pseudozobellia sp. WGM2]